MLPLGRDGTESDKRVRRAWEPAISQHRLRSRSYKVLSEGSRGLCHGEAGLAILVKHPKADLQKLPVTVRRISVAAILELRGTSWRFSGSRLF